MAFAFAYVAIVGVIAYRGIRESMWTNVALTLMEAGGLLLVIAVSLPYWGSVLDEVVDIDGVKLVGLGNLPSEVAQNASEMLPLTSCSQHVASPSRPRSRGSGRTDVLR